MLATLELSRQESFPKVADLIAALRKNLKQIRSAKQHRAIAALIDQNEAFSNLILDLTENLIKNFSELQTSYNTITASTIKAHERGQDLVSGLTKPSQN